MGFPSKAQDLYKCSKLNLSFVTSAHLEVRYKPRFPNALRELSSSSHVLSLSPSCSSKIPAFSLLHGCFTTSQQLPSLLLPLERSGENISPTGFDMASLPLFALLSSLCVFTFPEPSPWPIHSPEIRFVPRGSQVSRFTTTQSIYLHAPHFKTEATLNSMRLHKCLNFSAHLVRLRLAVLSLWEIQGTKSPRGHTPCPQLGWGRGMYICIYILK